MTNRLAGPLDPTSDAGWLDAPDRMGFFTDTSVCIGCKACEVACKEWNLVPEDGIEFTGHSYDNTGALGASTWRHVAFIEQEKPLGNQHSGVGLLDLGEDMHTLPSHPSGVPPVDAANPPGRVELGMPVSAGDPDSPARGNELRWLMSSDVCKHCTHAACLDVCPTGSLFRTEFGTVVVQQEICNGCGYCIPACPYGVIERRSGPKDNVAVNVAQKCTLCYDRLGVGLEPACAKACPTQSIQFGKLSELRERAAGRIEQLHAAGVTDAQLYGHEPTDGVGGAGAFFLLMDTPETYGFPPDPVVCTAELPTMWRSAALGGLSLLAAAAAAFLGARR